MKRSTINAAYHDALACFARHHWILPPRPRWDITDFGLGNFARHGLALVNLADEAEYCEKLMYARHGQTTPCHMHRKKKEDIICRAGELSLQFWPEKPRPGTALSPAGTVPVNGEPVFILSGEAFILPAGSRVTLAPGVWHAFWPASADCIIGEVSTHNDDLDDNFFLDPNVGRFARVEEDEPAAVRLVSD